MKKSNYVNFVILCLLLFKSILTYNMEKELPKENLYQILNVTKDAPQEEIKASYKKLSLLFHEDKYENNKKELAELGFPDAGSAAERFKTISEAYGILQHPAKRAHYDKIEGNLFLKLQRNHKEKLEGISRIEQILSGIYKKRKNFIVQKKSTYFKNLFGLVQDSLLKRFNPILRKKYLDYLDNIAIKNLYGIDRSALKRTVTIINIAREYENLEDLKELLHDNELKLGEKYQRLLNTSNNLNR